MQAEIEFSARINCFVGNNGSGKTNILDAIYYLSICKSYFNNIDVYNIRHGEEMFVIQGNYINHSGTEEIICSYKKNSRKIVKRNKKEYERLSEHIGLIPVVMVSPNDNSLITEGSEIRRKLIDSIISQYNKVYLEQLIQYNRILQQRNKLLKDFTESPNSNMFDIFEIYDQQLASLGKTIFEERVKFSEEFKPIFENYYYLIAGKNENARLVYQSQLSDHDLLKLLNESFAKDKALAYTTAGIHKDDILLLLDDLPIKRVASQGQQKTYLVALKLAEYEFLKNHSGKKPILLLDDIFDKFDTNRVKHIIDLTSNDRFGQIFITDTEMDRIHKVLDNISNGHRIFHVESGEISLVKNEQ